MLDTKSLDDDRVMNLVELALALPLAEREQYLRTACGADSLLFGQVWNYVQLEHRMSGFLLEPLCPPAVQENPFEPQELVDGRFRIVREVARGGMGVVYEAFDEKLERRVAIKCAQAGFRKWLPPEVRNAREIGHPNVCRIFEIHTASTAHGEIDFFTMEFLDGVTLAERLRTGPLPPAEARLIARQLCSGLAEAHRNGVIHGDLKSGNVILTTTSTGTIRAVITDFGLARRPEAAQGGLQSGRAGGTPAYMAPELWKGEQASTVSDVYALGVILYELACGQRPQAPDMSWEKRLAWKPPAVDPKWDRILQGCLDPDPARRYRDGSEVAQAFAPPHSHRWFVAAIAAALLVAIASGLVTYLRTAAPAESIRLAMLPFEADRDSAAISSNIRLGTAGQLALLKGSGRTKFTFIPSANTRRQIGTVEEARSALGATHVLHGSLVHQNGKFALTAYLTDARSLVNAKEWDAQYMPDETRFAAVALAGVVTEALHLPPSATPAEVNLAAREDYAAGMKFLSRDSTVDRALPLLTRSVSADPDSPLTYAGLAQAEWFKYYITRDGAWRERTQESLHGAEIRNPDLPLVHRIRGLLDTDFGRYEQAESEYRRAIELEPANGDAYRWLAAAYEGNNQLEDALAAFRRAIEVEPDNYRNYQNMGSFYFDKSNYEEAAVQFRKAVDHAREEPAPHLALGSAFMNLGQFADEENEFRLALKLRETPTALHALGVALMDQGKDREAIPYIVRALRIGPERYLWWMNLGIAYRRVNMPLKSADANHRGLELAELDIEKNPRSGYARILMAYMSARLGDRRRAESEIVQALALSPNNADVRYIGAMTYEALGQRDKTLSLLATSPHEVVVDISRYPDLADLSKDPRFIQLLASHGPK